MIDEAFFTPSPPPPSLLLAPGFRFRPTDEELVSYYLKRKVTGRPILFDSISEVDLYKVEPWDLPAMSRLSSRDLEWYFFTPLDRKYSSRSRTNRFTTKGYWKMTGNDRRVRQGSRVIGVKKTLVFYLGRAPRGERTNWVMHEYCLEDEDLARSGIPLHAYAICRIFLKSASGPRNGAPFVEEEWDRGEELSLNLVQVNVGGNRYDVLMDVAVDDYLELGDFLQDQDSSIQHEDVVSHAASFSVEVNGDGSEEPSTSQCEQQTGECFLDYLAVEDFLVDELVPSLSPPCPDDGYTELHSRIG